MDYKLDASGATAARPATQGRGLGLALLIIATAQLMLVLDDTIVNVALPAMQRSLHLPASSLNWVISFYALAFGGLQLAGGRAATCSAGCACSAPGSPSSSSRRWPAGSRRTRRC